ncbi:MAG TPA: ParB/RepB/Spo0J family partition protein [Ideonella sp.]|uniref:ParB/RepB/Spo0J family partition protein n=1 Tax=Ideonella sp. TaxID=1929293 RepID=UPI002D01EA28|nr:ParB/RepB/Spo0J family partition protein [Ideonella sp.]HSI48139.1 ParB/RepB/Spo0J family partition protein [Ideonella sp.]
MRLPWNKSKEVQLDLLDAEPGATAPHQPVEPAPQTVVPKPDSGAISPASAKLGDRDGSPMLVAVSMLYEDSHNPRTEFPEDSLADLAADIQQRGVLQPLVVHPAGGDGRHRVHFGAKRLRAAIRAGLLEVPVVVRDLPADRYAQVAENQKRQGLTPLELARFIRAQVDAGDSNATIAKQLGMNLTAVAHHLSLLALPLVLDDALKSGRCTSPRTLHELSKLHADSPGQVQALLASGVEITRATVSTIRSAVDETAPTEPAVSPPDKLIAQAKAACDRLERALSRIKPPDAISIATPELIALRSRVEGITTRWLQGSDSQTPSQAER